MLHHITVSESTHNSWLYCVNEDGLKESTYKLHIALGKDYFDQYEKQIYELLTKAVETGIVPSFKRLNCGNGQDLRAILGTEEKTITEDARTRLFNNPFTVYLYDEPNDKAIAQLCQEIELILKDVPPVNTSQVSIADLPFTAHITFRQDNLGGEYIAIAGASSAQLTSLKEEAEQSQIYKHLKLALAEGKAGPTKNEVLDFYNANYAKLSKGLNAHDTRAQLNAACTLLGIEKKIILERNTPKEKYLNLINKQSRAIKLKFHPDKNPTCFSAAGQLFQLVLKAEAFLKEVIEKPHLVDFTITLKQNPKKPQHQYELAEGFKKDPYYYAFMAKDNKTFILKQFWEIKTEKHTIFYETQDNLGDDTSSPDEQKTEHKPSSALMRSAQILEVYQPAVQFLDKPKNVKLCGPEAFYHLFMSNALPNHFSQYHLYIAMGSDKDTGYSIKHAELLKKALQTIEFICFSDSNYLIDLAIKATKEKIINIGETPHEVLLYYLKNHPESIYSRRIDKFIKYQDFDAKAFVKKILSDEDRHALYQLQDGTIDNLLALDKSLCQLVFNDPLLFKKISDYFWHYRIVGPFILNKCGGFDGYCKEILKLILYGLAPDLSFLSLSQIKKFSQFFETATLAVEHHFAVEIPRWAHEHLHAEIAKKELNMLHLPKDFILSTDYCKIKDEILKDNFLIVNAINKTVLELFLDDKDIHWGFYLDILFQMQEEDTQLSTKFLAVLQKELQSCETAQFDKETSLADKIKGLKESKEASEISKNARMKFKEDKIDALKNEFIKCLTSVPINEEEIKKIKTQFYIFGFKNTKEFYEHVKKLVNRLYQLPYEKLLTKNLAEEEKDQIKKDLHAYSDACDVLCSWDELPFKSILENDAYSMMRSILSVDGSGCFGHSTRHRQYHKFGIDPNKDPPLDALEKLFFVYDCAKQPQLFYEALGLIIHKKFPLEKDQDPVVFSRDEIEKYLLDHLDYELCVFADGQRESAPYKFPMYFDNQNIKKFQDLRALYLKLGHEQHYQAMIQEVYKELNANKKIHQYILIRKYEKNRVNPSLEALAIQEMQKQLKLLFKKNLLLDEKVHFYSNQTNKKLVLLRDQLFLPGTRTLEEYFNLIKKLKSLPDKEMTSLFQHNYETIKSELQTSSLFSMTDYGDLPEDVATIAGTDKCLSIPKTIIQETTPFLARLEEEINKVSRREEKYEGDPVCSTTALDLSSAAKFRQALVELFNQLKKCEPASRKASHIANETANMLQKIRETKADDQSTCNKLMIIQYYAKKCERSVFGWDKISRYVGCVVAAAVGFVVGAVVGGLIGTALGAFSGPGAVFTGAVGFFAGGCKGAAIGASLFGASALGITTGFFAHKYVFFRPSNDELDQAVEKVVTTSKSMLNTAH